MAGRALAGGQAPAEDGRWVGEDEYGGLDRGLGFRGPLCGVALHAEVEEGGNLFPVDVYVYDKEAYAAQQGEECGAEAEEFPGVGLHGGVAFVFLCVEQEHEGGGGAADAVGAGIGGVTDAFVQRFYLPAGVACIFRIHFAEFSIFSFFGEVEECGCALGGGGESVVEI